MTRVPLLHVIGSSVDRPTGCAGPGSKLLAAFIRAFHTRLRTRLSRTSTRRPSGSRANRLGAAVRPRPGGRQPPSRSAARWAPVLSKGGLDWYHGKSGSTAIEAEAADPSSPCCLFWVRAVFAARQVWQRPVCAGRRSFTS